MDSEKALYFRNEFRKARAVALEDAEGYQQILFVLERFGAYMFRGGDCEEHGHQEESRCGGDEDKKANGLGTYMDCIIALVKKHHPFKGNPRNDYHIALGSLYRMIMQGRNDALHQGAFARTLTLHLVELSLFLEDTFMAMMDKKMKDYMTRNPMCATEWQPVSFVRQMMLANSFSYIPVYMKKEKDKGKWYIISDYNIAMYLRPATKSDCRRKLLDKSIKDAIGSGKMAREEAFRACCDETVGKVLERIKKKSAEGKPILVVKKRDNCEELLGIATAHDLM